MRTFCLECKTVQWCKFVTNKVLCNKCIKKLNDSDYIEALKEVELIAPGVLENNQNLI